MPCCLSDFPIFSRSEEHTSELQSQSNLVCRLLLEKKKKSEDEDSNTSAELVIRNVMRERVPTGSAVSRCPRYSLSGSLLPLSIFFFFFFKESGPPRILPFSPPRPSPD